MSAAVYMPVAVGEETIDVLVDRHGDSWRAHAKYRGREIECDDVSISGVLEKWRQRAADAQARASD